MKVIGLDISLTGTGIASTTGWTELVGQPGITNLPLNQRIRAVEQLKNQILTHTAQPDLVVIEGPAMRDASGGLLERYGLWWLIIRSLHYREIPTAIIAPTQLKLYALGSGRGTKGAVVEAVAKRWRTFQTGGNDNLADAIILAAMGADHLGEPLALVPHTHRRVLDKINWPPPLDHLEEPADVHQNP